MVWKKKHPTIALAFLVDRGYHVSLTARLIWTELVCILREGVPNKIANKLLCLDESDFYNNQ